eukprot:scaffold4287_cov110-Skeletonema_dohrnii-CCMP3373.AAC.3
MSVQLGQLLSSKNRQSATARCTTDRDETISAPALYQALDHLSLSIDTALDRAYRSSSYTLLEHHWRQISTWESIHGQTHQRRNYKNSARFFSLPSRRAQLTKINPPVRLIFIIGVEDGGG